MGHHITPPQEDAKQSERWDFAVSEKRLQKIFFRRSLLEETKKNGLCRFSARFLRFSTKFQWFKNSAILEPRTGQLSRTWGFEAKAKDFKMCPRELHLWLYEQLQVLNIDEIYKLEVAKFMAKVNLNKLPVFCSNQSTIFRTLFAIHTYSIRSVSFKSFYVERTSLLKTNQSLKISGVKIWNSLPRHIRDKF